MTRAEDHERRWIKYGYNQDGMLASVTGSDGRARHYSYDGHLMTVVRDDAGRVLIRNTYRDTLLWRQTYSNGDSYQIDYSIGANGYYMDEATIAFPDGSTRRVRTGDSVPQFLKDIRR